MSALRMQPGDTPARSASAQSTPAKSTPASSTAAKSSPAKFTRKSTASASGDKDPVDCTQLYLQSNDPTAQWPVPQASDAQGSDLETLIETQVIPRLLMLHTPEAPKRGLASGPARAKGPAGPIPARRSGRGTTLTPRTIESFSAALRKGDIDAARAEIEVQLAVGADPQDLMIGLLAPAARHLGVMWEADEVDFVSVTLALSHLQTLFNALRAMQKPLRRGDHTPAVSMLMSVLPGEQHTFGLQMAAQALERVGVKVQTEIPLDMNELTRTVRGRAFNFVGLSIGSESLMDRLASAIEALRSASPAPDVRILVGGPAIHANPVLASSLDADYVTGDVSEAIAYVVSSLSSDSPA